ncbi:MAG: CPBP family glutamic-type intramembrane protease [Verrucomicrobiota bacterium]
MSLPGRIAKIALFAALHSKRLQSRHQAARSAINIMVWTAVSLATLTLSYGVPLDLATTDSHTDCIKYVEESYEKRFEEIVNAYQTEIDNEPDNSIVATEYCLFLEHVLYSDTIYIEEADTLLEKAKSYLDKFENDPAVEIYRLSEIYGDEVVDHGIELLSNDSLDWTDAQLALIHLRIAQQLNVDGKHEKTQYHARRSLEADQSTAAQLLLAESLLESHENDSAIELLNESLPDETGYDRLRKMRLFSKLGAAEQALHILQTLTEEDSAYLGEQEKASLLAQSGLIEEARAAYDTALANEWSINQVSKEYFDFEMKYGTGTQALIAYNLMRDQDYFTDPFLYYRLKLFAAHPTLPWKARDILGAAGFITFVIVVGLVPLLWILPTHYWGLMREKAGKINLRMSPNWSLWENWWITAFFFVTTLLTAFYFVYEHQFSNVFEEFPTDVPMPSDLTLARLTVVSTIVSLLGLSLLIGPRRFVSAIITSDWTFRRTLFAAFIAFIALCFVIGITRSIDPMAIVPLIADVSFTDEAIISLLNVYGPFALIGIIVIAIPIVEELIFRGVILTSTTNYIPFAWANVLQALIFASIHDKLELGSYVFLFAFGLVAGYLRKRSNGLMCPILLHVLNNGLYAIALILTQSIAAKFPLS